MLIQRDGYFKLNFTILLDVKILLGLVKCREFRVVLLWELLYADDLVVIAETEEDLIKRLNEGKNNVETRGMRVDMNKTKVMISGERQKPVQKASRWPCGVCGRGVGSNSIQCTGCQK